MDLVELKKENISERHPWETIRIKIVADKISDFLSQELLQNKVINVLDVGSGDAYVIDQLASQFPQLRFHGIDIFYNEELLTKVRSRLSHPNDITLFSDWKDPELVTTKIDLVLFLDVLEHIEDDIAMMKNVSELLPYDFKFIITVPAFQFLFASHDEFLVHYRRYSNKLLKKHIDQAGWQEVQSGYFYSSLVLPRLLIKIKEFFFKPTKEADGISEWTHSPWITKLVSSVFWFDYKMGKAARSIGIKIPGLSNYMIGKRTLS